MPGCGQAGAFVSILIPPQHRLFTPELQRQPRGQTAYLTGVAVTGAGLGARLEDASAGHVVLHQWGERHGGAGACPVDTPSMLSVYL